MKKPLLITLVALTLSACGSVGSDTYDQSGDLSDISLPDSFSQVYETAPITLSNGAGGTFSLPANNHGQAFHGSITKNISTGTFYGTRLAYGAYGTIVPYGSGVNGNLKIVFGTMKTAPQNIPHGSAFYLGNAIFRTDRSLEARIHVDFDSSSLEGYIYKDNSKLVHLESNNISYGRTPDLTAEATYLPNRSTGNATAKLSGPHAEEIVGIINFPGHEEQNMTFGGQR